jgi:hypothetical protein
MAEGGPSGAPGLLLAPGDALVLVQTLLVKTSPRVTTSVSRDLVRGLLLTALQAPGFNADTPAGAVARRHVVHFAARRGFLEVLAAAGPGPHVPPVGVALALPVASGRAALLEMLLRLRAPISDMDVWRAGSGPRRWPCPLFSLLLRQPQLNLQDVRAVAQTRAAARTGGARTRARAILAAVEAEAQSRAAWRRPARVQWCALVAGVAEAAGAHRA